MKTTIQEFENTVVVSLSGRLDRNQSLGLLSELTRHMQTASQLLIDVGDAEITDSTAIAVFIGALQQARQLDISFGLIALNGNIRQMIRLFRLDRLMPAYPTIEAALNHA